MARKQSEQRSEQKASAQEAAMAMTMMMMAVMSTEDHVPQGQDTKQTQHCDVPPFRRFACTSYLARVHNTIWEAENTGVLLQNMNGYFSKEKRLSSCPPGGSEKSCTQKKLHSKSA